MASYDYREYETKRWLERYPTDVVGITEWREQRSGPDWLGFGPVSNRRGAPARGASTRPRIFVSHRQIDVGKAARIAWLADQEGFEFWLDAFDPSLKQLQTLIGTGAVSAHQAALATAAIVEMALLNSSHVIATMTTNTKGSQWVPYEYGRAKEVAPITVQAGCWLDSGLLSLGSFPEYLHLGEKTFSEADIRVWFSSEFKNWQGKYGSTATAPANNWRGSVPPRL